VRRGVTEHQGVAVAQIIILLAIHAAVSTECLPRSGYGIRTLNTGRSANARLSPRSKVSLQRFVGKLLGYVLSQFIITHRRFSKFVRDSDVGGYVLSKPGLQ